MSKQAQLLAHLAGHWFLPDFGLVRLRAGLTRAVLRAERAPERRVVDNDHDLPACAYEVQGTTAVVYVRGIILPDSTEPWVLEWTGWQSYSSVIQSVQAACRDGRITDVRLDFDCLGGAATGCYEAGLALLELGKAKPIVAYARGYCTSAAYWLACACSRIDSGPDGVLGSIGTVGELYDDTEMLAGWGIRRIVVTGTQSPRKRTDLSAPDGLVEIQQEIDDLTENFVLWVAARRGRTREYVITEMGGGSSMVGARALAAGLCDTVAELLPGTLAVPAPSPTTAEPAAEPAPETTQPARGAAPGRQQTAPPPMRSTGDTMDSFEPQCVAAVAAAVAALSVLDAENADHEKCRTACDAVVTAGKAALDAGGDALKPGSEQGIALADACDSCAEACGELEFPECTACAASCASCSQAARGTTATTTEETQMTAQEKALRAKLARAEIELRAERTTARAASAKMEDLDRRTKAIEDRENSQAIQRMLDRHDARGVIGVDAAERKAWEKDAHDHGIEFVDQCLSRIPDGAVRPVRLRGSDQSPESIAEAERKRAEIAAIVAERKCTRAEAMRIWARGQQQKEKETPVV